MCRSASRRNANSTWGSHRERDLRAYPPRSHPCARQGGGAGTALGFFLAVVVLLPIGLGPDQALLQRIAPGSLWIALLFSVLLSADRIFQQDYEDGSLDIMAMAPFPRTRDAGQGHRPLAAASLPLAIAAPLLGFLINLDPPASGRWCSPWGSAR